MTQQKSTSVTWPEIIPAVTGKPEFAPIHRDPSSSPSRIAHKDVQDVQGIFDNLPQNRGELAASKKYQLVVLGLGEGKGRESILVRLPPVLLDRLGELANGSRSTLIELALHHMVNELAQAKERGEPMMMIEERELQEALEKDLSQPNSVASSSIPVDFELSDEAADEDDDCPDLNKHATHLHPDDRPGLPKSAHSIKKANKIIKAPHLRRRFPLSREDNGGQNGARIKGKPEGWGNSS